MHLVALDFSAAYEARNPHQWAEVEGQQAVYYRDQMRRLAATAALKNRELSVTGIAAVCFAGWFDGIVGLHEQARCQEHVNRCPRGDCQANRYRPGGLARL